MSDKGNPRDEAFAFAAMTILWVFGSMALLGPVGLMVAGVTTVIAFLFALHIVGGILTAATGAGIGMLLWGGHAWLVEPINTMVAIYRDYLFDGSCWDTEGLWAVFGRMIFNGPAWPFFAPIGIAAGGLYWTTWLVLYPSSTSLPAGLYVRSFDQPDVGKIIAFTPPDAAIRYQKARGQGLPEGFLFMKPVIAKPGDHVCNSADGLFVDGRFLALTASHDAIGQLLPIWQECGQLGKGRYFTFSSHAPNSFDSRHFGPIEADEILGIYRPVPELREPTALN